MIEQQVLSSILTNQKNLIISLQFPDDIFEDGKNKKLFNYILDITNTGLDVDFSVIMSYLKKINKFDFFGTEYFTDLMQQEPIFNFETTINNLNEKRIKNLIQYNTKDLYRSIEKGELDYESFIDEIIKLQNKLVDKNNNSICLAELPCDLDQIFKESNYLAFDLGILNEYLRGMFNGNLICIAGQPGAGKTNFALQQAYQYKSLFVSLEMTYEELYARILASKCEIPAMRIETEKLLDFELEKIMKIHMDKRNNDFHVMTGPTNFYQLLNNIKHKVKTNDLELVVIDYIQLCNIPKADTNTKIEIMTSSLKSLAKELDIPIIILSQLTKDSYRNTEEPMLASLRGSGSLAQDSDVVFILWFDADEIFRFTVAKSRKTKIGIIPNLKFNGKFSRFEETFC